MVHKILVVDGNPIFLDLMRIVLHANGYSVKTAFSCSIAKELLDSWKPNLIILDSNISGKNALGFTEAIQIFSYIPILLLTASDNHLIAQECLVAGANEWISKPVSIYDLLEKVNSLEHGIALPNYQYQVAQSIRAHSIVE